MKVTSTLARFVVEHVPPDAPVAHLIDCWNLAALQNAAEIARASVP